MLDHSIQKTIAICYELHDDFKGKMKKSVKYAQAVYLGPHRNLIRLYEHLYPELKRKPSLNTQHPTAKKEA